MKRTSIEWTDLSSNPLQYRDKHGRVVWGCVKKSAGCSNCYSEAIAHHYDRGGPFTRATMETLTPFLDEKELKHILNAKKIGGKPVAGCRCFLGDMTDVFGDWVPDELLDRLFAVMAWRAEVTFQILTKRPDRMAAYMQRLSKSITPLENAARAMGLTFKFRGLDGETHSLLPFPLPNIWLGVSVEHQAAADERIPHLLATPATVRFISAEPLLGPVNLAVTHLDGDGPSEGTLTWRGADASIDWCIVGAESGPNSRPMYLEWARSLVRQCRITETACFVKQLGQHPIECEGGRTEPPGCVVDPAPCRKPNGDCALTLIDRKGGDPAEWPSDLRVREFPKGSS